MRFAVAITFFLVAAVLAVPVVTGAGIDPKGGGVPFMRSVEPGTARAGQTITITGEYLDVTHVTAVYLTEGNNDIEAKIVSQSEDMMKVVVPANAKPGRHCLMVLMSGPDPKLIEQPVSVLIVQ